MAWLYKLIRNSRHYRPQKCQVNTLSGNSSKLLCKSLNLLIMSCSDAETKKYCCFNRSSLPWRKNIKEIKEYIAQNGWRIHKKPIWRVHSQASSCTQGCEPSGQWSGLKNHEASGFKFQSWKKYLGFSSHLFKPWWTETQSYHLPVPLLVRGSRYPGELVEELIGGLRHHHYNKKKKFLKLQVSI